MDRLEMVYMDLPEEAIEKEIVLKEQFQDPSGRINIDPGETQEKVSALDGTEETEQGVLTPWWILEVIGKAVRLARSCPRFDKKPTIRATIRAFDHTRSTAEMNQRRVPTLADTGYGLKLALRSRVSLQPEYVNFENPGRISGWLIRLLRIRWPLRRKVLLKSFQKRRIWIESSPPP
jgi:hypothetical protein